MPLLERGLVTGCAAGLSGSLAALVTTPVDVVKTRIMLAAGRNGGHAKIEDPGKVASKGGFTIAKEIWREQGIRGLFRGGLLRSAWTMLGSGLYLSVYESGRQYLEDRRERKDDG